GGRPGPVRTDPGPSHGQSVLQRGLQSGEFGALPRVEHGRQFRRVFGRRQGFHVGADRIDAREPRT
ncbi:hypothetical protein ACFWAX_42190, partial [Streptomyces sp. NPDC059956]|uniref:hypothetical protein n=1 Tax=Streptomyces sp. NPDC059956 TaxID=3347015 RepID=UPI0036607087